MTGRCSTCFHWSTLGAGDYIRDINLPDDPPLPWGVCGLIDLPSWDEPLTITAYCQDGSDYRANLICRADFGCVLHELKPAGEEG